MPGSSPTSWPALRAELKTLARLSAPVALAQLGLMAMGAVDTMMVGQLGAEPLGAVALANMWFWGWLSLLMGIVLGTDPLMSQAHGRNDGAFIGLTLQRGLIVSCLVSIPMMISQLLTGPGLELLGQSPNIAALAQHYNGVRLASGPAFLVFTALRQYLQSRGIVRPAAIVIWATNGLNVLFNWALIFGHLGFPALGVTGAALATALSSVSVPVLLAATIVRAKLHEGAWSGWSREAWRRAGLVRILRLGFPIGLHMTLETWAFSVATFMSGWLGLQALGSHHVALNLAALAFMIPLGLSIGAATRVGNLIGAGDQEAAARASWLSVALGAAVMSCAALGFVLGRNALPALFTTDQGVVSLAARILPIVAAFQLFDSTQVICAGILRGLGRPNAGALINLVGYFAFALPLGYFLAFHRDLGLHGIWYALAVGLFSVATLLALWVRRTLLAPLERLQIDS